jgi:ABC-2 type transport system permease protein
MPDFIKTLAAFSPLNWGLNAFQNIFLSEGTFVLVKNDVYKLLLFFAGTLLTALVVNRFKNKV